MSTVEQLAAGRQAYALRTSQKISYLILAAALAAMAALFFIYGSGDLHPEAAIAASAILALSALYLALVALRSRLVFDGPRLRVQGPLLSREFDLSDVAGFRTYKSRYGSYQVICLKGRASTIRLMKYETDARLDDWFAHLADLDQQDREQILEKIDRDEELGATTGQRRSALTHTRQIGIVAALVNVAVAAAFILGPPDYRLSALTVLALVPVAAAFTLYRQPLLYGVLKARGDPRVDVSPLLLISGFALFFRASRVNFVSIGLLLPFVAFAALAMLALFYPGARKNPRLGATLTGLFVLSAFYGWGVAASADVAADRSMPQTYSAQILGGHVSRGSRSTTYYLVLEPWGPYFADTMQMKVSPSAYHAAHRGDLVCLALHQGALHAPWYEIVPCPSPANP